MRLAPTLALALLACEAGPRIPLPPRGPCADEVPDEEVTGGRVVVFPERDWICPAEPPDATCRPLRSDPERTVRVTEELGGATFVFVLDRMTIPVRGTRGPECEPAGFVGSYGLDLDRRDSGRGSNAVDADCEAFAADDASAIEPGVTGVDNAFQELVELVERAMSEDDCPESTPFEEPGCILCPEPACRPTSYGCIDRVLGKEVHAGHLLVLLEVTGVDSLLHDPEVEVALYAGRVWGGGPPAVDSATARLRPGQAFETLGPIAEPTTGDLFHGRLRARWDHVWLPRVRYGYPEALLDAELRVAICEAGAFAGQLGGSAEVDALVRQLEEVEPSYAHIARSILGAVADLEPGADPAVCERISVAYSVEGVPATRHP